VTAFDYLSVLLSIVLGLALTQLLTGVARLIKARDRVRLYSPPIVWMAILFVVIVQSWWAMFSLREHNEWTILGFLVVMVHPVVLFLMVELLMPEVNQQQDVDLANAYERQAPLFFSAILVLMISSLLRPVVLSGKLAEPLDVIMQAVFFALSAVAIFWRSNLYHRVLAPLTALLVVTYIALLFLDLR
jgi:hypothetical protein